MSYFENINNDSDIDEPKINNNSDSDDNSDDDNSGDNSDDENKLGGGDDDILSEDDDILSENDDILSEDDEAFVGGGADYDNNDDDDDQLQHKKSMNNTILQDDNNEEEDEEEDEDYLTKFDNEINQNYLLNHHPECVIQNYDEIIALSKVIRDKNNIIIDDLHKTIPFLTKYEKTRVLGQRTKQLSSGAFPYVKVPENIIDSYLIAQLELQQKRIPFIIRRPIPNGGSEFWCIKDLENISF